MKIGITERGDAGLDYSWQNKLSTVDGAVLITKSLSPKFREAVSTVSGKVIVHVTCTGYGGTVLEPNVPKWDVQLMEADKFNSGFKASRVVIRVDPIIPTEKGITTAKAVIVRAADMGFKRFRVSVLDMYPHVKERFAEAGLPLPYGDNFYPDSSQFEAVDAMLAEIKDMFPDIVIEGCAEPQLRNVIQAGCIGPKEISILCPNETYEKSPYQRATCMCCGGKTELLNNKHRCPNGCLYCYWKDK